MQKMGNRFISMFLTFVMIVAFCAGLVSVPAYAALSPTGTSTQAQTVKSGPSYSYYTNVGSISTGEQVMIISSFEDWYHIRYIVTSSGNYKDGYVPKSNISNVSSSVYTESYVNGGERISNGSQTVWSTDVYSKRISVGSIGQYEPVTLLDRYQAADISGNHYDVAYIEYSTSGGTKRGYLFNPSLSNAPDAAVSSVAVVKNAISVYSTTSATSANINGSLGKGEVVTIVGKTGDWVYIEYNTTAGRKRAFTSVGNLNLHHPGLYYTDIAQLVQYGNLAWTPSQPITLYAGPSQQYVSLYTIPYGMDVIEYQPNFLFTGIDGHMWSYAHIYTGTKGIDGWLCY